MSTTASNQELAQAIIDHVETGAYPTSENVASASLPTTALPTLLEGIDKGRESVKAELRELSRNTAGDLNGWIKQAKQLQGDIEQSKTTAKEICQEAEASNSLRAHVEDTTSKVELLRNELDFNETLIGALEQLQIATGLLDKAKEAESENELVSAVKELGNAQKVMAQLDSLQNSRFGGLLQRRATQIREALVAKVAKCWSKLVVINHEERQINLHREVEDGGVTISLDETVEALAELGTLESYISRLHRDLDHVIIGPRFTSAPDGAFAQLRVREYDISISGRGEGFDLTELVRDIRMLAEFLVMNLPERACKLLLGKLLPGFLVQIVTNQLDPSVPVSVDELATYESSLSQVEELASYIEQFGISLPSDGDLSTWIERLPQTWLSRRREATLTSLRASCYDAVRVTKTAERVETQMVSSDDVMVAGEQQDDWNENWSDDGEKEENTADEDDDTSAWGLDDEAESKVPVEEKLEESADKNEDEEDAWGWGDDETTEEGGVVEAPSTVVAQKPVRRPAEKTNGPTSKSKPVTQKEMTLREPFAITAIPDTLLDLINAVLLDADRISQPSFPIPAVTAAAQALSPIPTLLLALYRATARSFYSSSPVADLLIYNDSENLTTRLDELLTKLLPDHPLARRLPRALETEIKSLQTFSRLAYGREMDSQRTILSDLLSSTSGFASCTNPLNAREYQSAIEDVIARVRDIDKLWANVLCESARKQSLGTLLSHVVRKVVTDILELAGEPQGISEEESKQLKSYLDQIAELSDMFNVAGQDGEARSLVHVYTPAWLRFNYLGEILEASLADIKFLWTEGELRLEFEGDEVVELIEALFAESQYRRDAIREIRGGIARA